MDFISSNRITLNSYEEGIHEYIQGTAQETNGNIKKWIDHFLNLLSPNARIIEIGSAFGRDAQYIESYGYLVERTDAAQGFISFLNNQGYKATLFNILTDSFTAFYDLIFANAVFVHFNLTELLQVLTKIYKNLEHNGMLAFSLKHGKGEEWTKAKIGYPRYFCYYEKNNVMEILEKLNFKIIFIFEEEEFIQITAKKQ